MIIKSETPIVHLGKSGLLVTAIALETRGDMLQGNMPSDLKEKALSVGEFERNGTNEFAFRNPYTESELRIDTQWLRNNFQGTDLNDAFLSVKFEFRPDRGGKPLLVTDMVDELRRRGWPEDRIQSLLENAPGDAQ